MNIAGRFQRVSEIGTNPVVVGLIGKATADTINKENIEHIKAFYNKSGAGHHFIEDYPVKINRSLYTGFMVIE